MNKVRDTVLVIAVVLVVLVVAGHFLRVIKTGSVASLTPVASTTTPARAWVETVATYQGESKTIVWEFNGPYALEAADEVTRLWQGDVNGVVFTSAISSIQTGYPIQCEVELDGVTITVSTFWPELSDPICAELQTIAK